MGLRPALIIVAVLALCCAGAFAWTRAPHAERLSRHTSAIASGGSATIVSIVPEPRFIRMNGSAFQWPAHVIIRARSAAERNTGTELARFLAAGGVSASFLNDGGHANVWIEAGAGRVRGVGAEGYDLSASRAGVRIAANSGAGLFYGLQTLEQLSIFGPHGLLTPGALVRDWPRFAWRGMHLDVSRHFFAAPVLMRFIDLEAHYKLNVFHWHLTDDQAWRIAIPRYPRLAETGACHAGKCEYYTPEEVRAIVRYARARYVTVIPEIEIPGHSQAALRAYPQFACDRTPGVDVYCPTEATFAFLQNVLDRVAALFPGPYVHIGGDEVDPSSWRRSRYVRALMRSKRLENGAQLQAYMTRRIAAYLRSRGKRLVGWDEILSPWTSRGAIVMSWHGAKTVMAAVRRRNDVVVAADGPLYFDAFQGERAQEPRATEHMSTLAQVYDFNPVPDGLASGEEHRILGAQANLWTERIATPEHLFYMALPRELALAEILWTPSAGKNWASFLKRLPAQLAWLDNNHYGYRIPAPRMSVTGGRLSFVGVPGFVQRAAARTDAREVRVTLSEPAPNASLHYSLDGSDPLAASPVYVRPLIVRLDRGGVTVAVAAFLRDGRRSSISRCAIRRVSTRELRTPRNASHTWDALVSP